MAKVTYSPPVGDADFPSSTEQYGHWFDAGKAIDIEDKALIEKFRGNRYFTVADEPAPVESPVQEPEKRGRGRPPKGETNDGS